jgi:biopolymer transport protein ExbD
MEGAMLVRLRADGTLDLAGEALSGDRLQARLRTALARKPDQRVLLRPERGVAMQRAVEVLDLVASTGIKDVSLVRGR